MNFSITIRRLVGVSTASRFIFDLAGVSVVRRLLVSWLFPYVLQLAMLAALIGLIVVGFKTGLPDAGWARLFTFTNLTLLSVWVLFWPGQIILTLLFGRVWCSICPLEFLTNISYRVKQFLGIRGGLPLPLWMRQGTFAVVAFVAMQLAVLLFFAHEIPLYTAFTLVGLVVGALVVGAVFREPRAFCHGFCPAMPMLHLYNRFSPVGLHHINDDLCANCTTRECVDPARIALLNNRSCPSLLPPHALTTTHNCTLCMQCLKVCPHKNIGYGLSRRDIIERVTSAVAFPLAVYIFIELGFVFQQLLAGRHCLLVRTVYPYLAEMLSMLRRLPLVEMAGVLIGLPLALGGGIFVWRTLMRRLDGWQAIATLAAWAAFPVALGTFLFILSQLDYLTGILTLNIVWLLAGFPAALAGMLFGIARFAGATERFVPFLTRVAPYLLPVVAAGHVDRAILEINQRLPYLSYALAADPMGMTMAQKMAAGTVGELHSTLVPLWFADTALIILLLAGYFLALYLVFRRLPRPLAIAAYVGISVTAMIYLVLLLNIVIPNAIKA